MSDTGVLLVLIGAFFCFGTHGARNEILPETIMGFFCMTVGALAIIGDLISRLLA